ncbi:hypothetical protein LL965_07270 [Xanthomonas cassavae CFBP 4642]|uniref:DNA (cytosine-5-)-methyltransferase n=1 Tax=Xanthomonas cassavae CFBP 4642 TaxID=1219375 RepID=A0ABS8HE49_9XANT|nr:DNA cytosine methyltransferase [Xanthomonas cassavae]MCC4619902.1 hypothetical protein [Xanthomonas cassavae CFBP 4642]
MDSGLVLAFFSRHRVLFQILQLKRERELMSRYSEIPVIDLFAGPGGLCEGFSSILDENGVRRFSVKVSVEKDPIAHRTLLLRAIFRKFPKGKVPDCYYDYVRGKITREAFLEHPDITDAAEHAAREARCAELGVTPAKEVDGWIREGGLNLQVQHVS